MNEVQLVWRERASESEFVASVWSCNAPAATTRTVLADACISISFVKENGSARVWLGGPETKPRTDLLGAGYACITIRLQPGVLLQGFPAQKFINSSLAFPADAARRFWFEGVRLQFPDFDNAELLIDQLHALGYLSHEAPDNTSVHAKRLSPRSYSRLVKRTTGLSPYRLHELQRMHQALRLLKQGATAATVAAELNFVDQSHLTHASRQFLGHTPKQLLHLPQIP